MLGYTHSNVRQFKDDTVLIADEYLYADRERTRMRMTKKPDIGFDLCIAGIIAMLALGFFIAVFASYDSASSARTHAGEIGLSLFSYVAFAFFIGMITLGFYWSKDIIGVIRSWRTAIPSGAKFVHMEDMLIKTLRSHYRGNWMRITHEILDGSAVGGAYYFVIESYVKQAFHLKEPFTFGTTNASRKPVASKAMNDLAMEYIQVIDSLEQMRNKLESFTKKETSIPATALFENALANKTELVET